MRLDLKARQGSEEDPEAIASLCDRMRQGGAERKTASALDREEDHDSLMPKMKQEEESLSSRSQVWEGAVEVGAEGRCEVQLPCHAIISAPPHERE